MISQEARKGPGSSNQSGEEAGLPQVVWHGPMAGISAFLRRPHGVETKPTPKDVPKARWVLVIFFATGEGDTDKFVKCGGKCGFPCVVACVAK